MITYNKQNRQINQNITNMNSFTKLIKSQPNEISDILKKIIKLETSDNILKNRLIKMYKVGNDQYRAENGNIFNSQST